MPCDRLAVERPGGEVGLDRVADAVVAAIDPGVDLERLAGDQHVARADDRAPRLVDHFGGDRVAVVLVGMDRLGHGRVDLDLHRAVGADLDFAARRPVRAAAGRCGHQNGIGRRQPQLPPAGIPVVVVGEPPVARPVEPVPRPDGIPALVVAGAHDLVLHLGLGDRRAEVVLRLDRGRDLLAEHDRLGRGVDRHLELGLLVLLDAEAAAAVVVDR